MNFIKRLFHGKLSTRIKPRIGLALGGGGARGLAHIGVLKALEEAGIEIDMVTGASMGGVIAAAYTVGIPVTELEEIAEYYAKPQHLVQLVDPTPFNRGILQGKRVRQFLESKLGAGTTFENLRMPLAVSATDLANGESLILEDGLLVDAIMATIAVPGLWPPVDQGGRKLADGGLLNNLPIDVLHRMGANVTIAVRVAPFFPRKDGSIPAVPFLPEFGAHFYQSILVMADALTTYQLMLTPPSVEIKPVLPDNIWLLGFEHADQAISAGETAAKQAIPAIRNAMKRVSSE